MIERQENSPTVTTLERLAAVLDIEPNLFFENREEVLATANKNAPGGS